MAKIITDKNRLDIWVMGKQINEQTLAKKLYEHFDTVLINDARGLALGALEVMHDGNLIVLRKGMEEEKELAVFTRRGNGKQFDRANIAKMITNIQAFDASDCSDIVRLLGAWVENGGLIGPGASGTTTDVWGRTLPISSTIKDAFRGGIQGGDWKSEVESVWASGKDQFEGMRFKFRDRKDRIGLPQHIHVNPQAGFTGMGGLMVNPQGVPGKEATFRSNTLKIDKIFGLLAGADISGTTADTVFALEALSQIKNLHLSPIMYMLPLATIVYNAHHTLLEVALPLTLNGAIDYHVGFYSTLLPPGSEQHSSAKTIKKILLAAENAGDNRHFMQWRNNGGQVLGGILFDKALEKIALKQARLSRAKELLKESFTLQINPNRSDVWGLIVRLGGNLSQVLSSN